MPTQPSSRPDRSPSTDRTTTGRTGGDDTAKTPDESAIPLTGRGRPDRPWYLRLGLLPLILVAIALGVLCGQFFPDPLAKVFFTFDDIFAQFLGFIIPLLIVALVAPAIADLGRGAGKWLVITAAIAYGSTLFSGFLSYGVASLTYPSLLAGHSNPKAFGDPSEAAMSGYFNIEMPPVFSVMTALLLAFCLGVGITLIKGDVMHEVLDELREIINRIIASIIIPLLPLYIFGMFLNLTMNGEIWEVLTAFLKVVVLALVMHVLLLLVQFTTAGSIVGANPFRAMKNMLPAYATALGTASSAATIPVTVECARRNGVQERIAGFTVPLCATIHLAGSTMKITLFSLAVIHVTGLQVGVGQYIGFIFMLGITMIAAPGVPGGAIMAAVGILESMLGFDKTATALMIATYIALDSVGTATNVTGDGAISMVVNKFAKGSLEQHDGTQDLLDADLPAR